MDNLKQIPVLGGLLSIIDNYPRISAWVVLSLGVVGILVYEARDVDLTTTNWVALIVASVLVSGLCIWIVSWEDEEELAADALETEQKPSDKPDTSTNA